MGRGRTETSLLHLLPGKKKVRHPSLEREKGTPCAELGDEGEKGERSRGRSRKGGGPACMIEKREGLHFHY